MSKLPIHRSPVDTICDGLFYGTSTDASTGKVVRAKCQLCGKEIGDDQLKDYCVSTISPVQQAEIYRQETLRWSAEDRKSKARIEELERTVKALLSANADLQNRLFAAENLPLPTTESCSLADEREVDPV